MRDRSSYRLPAQHSSHRKNINYPGWQSSYSSGGKKSHKQRNIAMIIFMLTILGIIFFSGNTILSGYWHKLFKSETYEFIFSSSKGKTKKTINKQDVIDTLRELTKNVKGDWGIYFYSFKNGETIGYNEDKKFQAASVNKVPIMLATYRQIEAGKLGLKSEYILKNSDIVDYGSGVMRYQEPGTEYTYEELLKLCGKQSDNTAAQVLANIIGKNYLEQFDASLGLKNTSIEQNETTAEDMGKYFQMVYEDRFFKDKKYKEMFFDNLTDTDFEDRIPKGIPEDIRVIHKIGNEIQTYNDCGIVMGKNPFVLCILSQGSSQEEAFDIIPKIATLFWDWETSN